MDKIKLKDIPNIITCFRIFLVAPFSYFMLKENYTIAFYIFFLSGFSDGIDGILARKLNCQSRFGEIADPLADKLLVVTSALLLTYLGKLPVWLFSLIIIRDLILIIGATIWNFLFEHVEVVPTWISKFNTTMQIFMIVVLLFELAYKELPPEFIFMVLMLTAITTLLSFIDYMYTWGKIAANKKNLKNPNE